VRRRVAGVAHRRAAFSVCSNASPACGRFADAVDAAAIKRPRIAKCCVPRALCAHALLATPCYADDYCHAMTLP